VATLEGINQKVNLGRNEEIGLIIYSDLAVFISNDYPGSGNRQLYFNQADDIKRLKEIFEQKNLPTISLAEDFESKSSILRCVTREPQQTIKSDSSNNTQPCIGKDKANKHFENLIKARMLSDDCIPVNGKVLIENYNGESITYTTMTYRCVKTEGRKTITCKGKWAGDLKGCIQNQFSLVNWRKISRENAIRDSLYLHKLERKINGEVR